MGTTELSAKPDEIMWGGGLAFYEILHVTPNQPLPKTPGKVRKLCDSFSYVNLQVLFFFKQTETCYLPSCDFRHLKPPSDPQLVVFPPAVLQVFP